MPLRSPSNPTATALHKDEADRETHEKMGFHQGWAPALDQLVAHIKALRP